MYIFIYNIQYIYKKSNLCCFSAQYQTEANQRNFVSVTRGDVSEAIQKNSSILSRLVITYTVVTMFSFAY